MSQMILSCVARQHGDVWEAFCVDLDIAVQGNSLEEAKDVLNRAIVSFIQDALKEEEPARSTLLNRRAPFFARLSWMWPFIVRTLFDRNRDGDNSVGFQVACHA